MINYGQNWLARERMISDVVFAHGKVKDAVTYCNRKAKRYGEIFKEVYGLAYETNPGNCYAKSIALIDEKICERYGWRNLKLIRSNIPLALCDRIEGNKI
jgi:hypothetical protein